MGKRIQLWASIALGAAAAVMLACVVLMGAGGGGGAIALAPAALEETAAYAVIDLNRATEEELMALPGIGETLAGRIVQWREENGDFRTREDVLSVQGIGETTYEKLAPYITY